MHIGILPFSLYTMPSYCTVYVFREEVKASLNSVQVQHSYDSFLCDNNLTLSTIDNTFSLIRSCGKDVYKVENSTEETSEP